MNKHRKDLKNKNQPRFLQLFYWEMDSAAWKDLNATERALYIEVRRRYNGSNNGRIGYSVREAADEFKVSKDTAGRALRRLEDHGFIVAEKRGAFHCKVRHATEYRLTTYDSDIATSTDRLATKDFMRWAPEIQNTVRPEGPTVPVVVPIGPCDRTEGSENSPDGTTRGTVNAA